MTQNTDKKNVTYSFVIPAFNEEEVLPALFDRLDKLLLSLDEESEVILVDDGSRDKTALLMISQHQKDPRYRVVCLSRNFGHQPALTAGLEVASGKAVIILDADLQDPPEVVPEMIARWKEGYEVVYAQRKLRRKELWFKRTLAAVFYRVFRRVTDIDIPEDVGDFRLVDRKVLDSFLKLKEKSRYVRGMFSWVGFKQIGVPYRREGRAAGVPKYSFRTSLRLAVNAFLSFSNLPAQLPFEIGLTLSGFSTVVLLVLAGLKYSGSSAISGWAFMAGLISFFAGVQMAVLGLLGMYLGRIYEEVKERPLYLIQSRHGFEHLQQKNAHNSFIDAA